MKKILEKAIKIITNRWTQLITVLFLLIASIITFIYSLGFSTNWAVARTAVHSFSQVAQEQNRIFYTLGMISLVAAGFTLGIGGHRRKKFFWSNLVVNLTAGVINIVTGVYIIIQMLRLEPMYVALGSLWEMTHIQNESTFSTVTFTIGHFVGAIAICAGLLIILMTAVKCLTQPKRKTLNVVERQSGGITR